MLSTAPDVCLATCLARGYKGDQGVDHQIAVKIILGVNKDMFLDYGGGKRVRHKVLRRCKLDTYPDSSE